MKIKTIMEKKAREDLKFDTAIKMRQLLDDAKKAYGPAWDDDGIEEQINELVFGDEDE